MSLGRSYNCRLTPALETSKILVTLNLILLLTAASIMLANTSAQSTRLIFIPRGLKGGLFLEKELGVFVMQSLKSLMPHPLLFMNLIPTMEMNSSIFISSTSALLQGLNIIALALTKRMTKLTLSRKTLLMFGVSLAGSDLILSRCLHS